MTRMPFCAKVPANAMPLVVPATAAVHHQQRNAGSGLLRLDRPAARGDQRAASRAAVAGQFDVFVEASPDRQGRHRDDDAQHADDLGGASRPKCHGENSNVSELTVPMKYGVRPSGRIQATSPVKGTCTLSRVW